MFGSAAGNLETKIGSRVFTCTRLAAGSSWPENHHIPPRERPEMLSCQPTWSNPAVLNTATSHGERVRKGPQEVTKKVAQSQVRSCVIPWLPCLGRSHPLLQQGKSPIDKGTAISSQMLACLHRMLRNHEPYTMQTLSRNCSPCTTSLSNCKPVLLI
jgi:hypothetical protein